VSSVAWLVLAMALAVFTVSCGGQDGGSAFTTSAASTTAAATTTHAGTTTQAATSSSTAATSTTTTAPTTTTQAAPKLGTRENPIPAGDTAQVGDWEIAVLAAIPDATQTVMNENPYNEPPVEGNQFLMVEVSTTYRGTGSSPVALGLTFSTVGESSVAYSFGDYCGVIPNELDQYAEVFTDGSLSGNLCWSIKASDAGSLVLIVDNAFSFDQERLFFEVPRS
jgi:hypothetical protein